MDGLGEGCSAFATLWGQGSLLFEVMNLRLGLKIGLSILSLGGGCRPMTCMRQGGGFSQLVCTQHLWTRREGEGWIPCLFPPPSSHRWSPWIRRGPLLLWAPCGKRRTVASQVPKARSSQIALRCETLAPAHRDCCYPPSHVPRGPVGLLAPAGSYCFSPGLSCSVRREHTHFLSVEGVQCLLPRKHFLVGAGFPLT